MKKKKFKRQETHKRKKVPSSWRKPKGRHSNTRLQKKHAPNMPKSGYRTPKKIRGLHPSGYEEKLVANMSQLEKLDSETEAARIRSTVGARKRKQILEKAQDLDIKVLNKGGGQ